MTSGAGPEGSGVPVPALTAATGPGSPPTEAALYRALLTTVERLAAAGTPVADLKIAQGALAEMADAFATFRPYRDIRKVTLFGSARTRPEDPRYRHARTLAATMAEAGWMVVTGAGPGIMAAGVEGAGGDRALGVDIRLPSEQEPVGFLADDPKLVQMRYFFTRKLMLMRESDAYVVLPGGFGTLDEAFELLTLLQTGKAAPAPVVLLDTPGGTYWRAWERFVTGEVAADGLISSEDRALYRITDDCEAAADELLGFYRNYHSSRWVGDLLVLRLAIAPSRPELASLNRRFADIVERGVIRPTRPLPPERAGDDHVDLPRIALRFDRAHYDRLRQLIDACNVLTG
jgi:hypothetical protein